MKYARIDNGRAVEFFEYDGNIYDLFPVTLTWVPCDQSVGAGYTYDATTKTFSAPVVGQDIINEMRRVEILAKLSEIDTESTRPLRAKLAGTSTAEDDAALLALEQQAIALRAELATLV